MKKDQKFNKALNASLLRPLSDEQISGAKNRVWAAIEREKATKAAISFFSFSFNRQLVPVLATYSLIIAILIGSAFALLPSNEQTQTIAIIKKTLQIDQVPNTTNDQPTDSANNDIAPNNSTITPGADTNNDVIPTKSTYTNTELAFSVELPGKFEKIPSNLSKPGFAQKDQLDVVSTDKSKSTLAVYTAENDQNQSITDWVKTHNIGGDQSEISFGSFNGVIVKSKPIARGIFSSFVAHATSQATEDFYTVKNGDILLLSAQSSELLTPPNYNDSFKTFKRSPMKVTRSKFAYAEYDGKIYILGGNTNPIKRGAGSSLVDNITRYDPDLDTWTDLAALPDLLAFVGRGSRLLSPLVQAVAIKGKIYYLPQFFSQQEDGKTPVGVYDIATNMWEMTTITNTDMIKNHEYNEPNGINKPAVFSSGDQIYFVGGYYFTGNNITLNYGLQRQLLASNEVFAFSPPTNQWIKLPNMNVARNSPAMTMHNGRLFVTYGNNGSNGDLSDLGYNFEHSGLTPTVEYFDFTQNKWVQTKNFPDMNFINPPNLVDISGSLYLFGKYTTIDKDVDDSWKDIIVQAYSYDDATTEWKYVTQQFNITNLTGVIGMGSSAYLLGGTRDSTYITEFVPKPK